MKTTRNGEDYLGQLPPHSMPTEQAIIGCMLLDPNGAIEQCQVQIKSGSRVFYDLRHRALFEHLVCMHDSKQPIDMVTLHQRLKDLGQIEAVGGMPYVAGCMDAVPSASNLSYYTSIAVGQFVRRTMSEKLRSMLETVQHEEAESVIDKIERMSLGLRELILKESDAVNIKEELRKLIDVYENAENGIRIPSVPTGFSCIERAIGGFRAGELIVIGARPKVGKTTLGLNIAQHAVLHGYPVGIFTLEMKAGELLQRGIASLSGVPSKDAENGWTNDGQKKKMIAAMFEIVKSPIMMLDQFTITVDQIAQQCRKWKKDKGLKMVLIDYLQLIDRPRDVRPVEAISEITRKLKNLAGDLDITVVLISQLNRQSEVDRRPPCLSDFRDSGSIEQDANIIFMLHQNPGDYAKIHLVIVGRRCKSSDDSVLLFHREVNRFENDHDC